MRVSSSKSSTIPVWVKPDRVIKSAMTRHSNFFMNESLVFQDIPYMAKHPSLAANVVAGDLRDYLKTIDIKSLRYPEDIVKYALHGFWGNVTQMLELYRDKKNDYICQHMTKIRESLRQKKNPRVMETLTRGIRVNWNLEVGFCGIPKKQAVKTMELCSEQCYNCPYVSS